MTGVGPRPEWRRRRRMTTVPGSILSVYLPLSLSSYLHCLTQSALSLYSSPRSVPFNHKADWFWFSELCIFASLHCILLWCRRWRRRLESYQLNDTARTDKQLMRNLWRPLPQRCQILLNDCSPYRYIQPNITYTVNHCPCTVRIQPSMVHPTKRYIYSQPLSLYSQNTA